MIEPDAALMARAQAGDEAALEALYPRDAPAGRGFFGARLGRWAADDADDLAAEVWVYALTTLSRWCDVGLPFGAWLYRIARWRLADHWRRRAELPLAPLDPEAHAAPDPFAGVEARVDLALLLARAHLSPGQRRLLRLRLVRPVPLSTAAAMLGITRVGAAHLQKRARDALRRQRVREEGRAA